MRRVVLSVFCSLMVWTAVGRPRASETEVEAAAYEGNTAGRWTCGPSGEVHYGGIGGRVRHSERAPSRKSGMGATVVGGAALEVAHLNVREEDDGSVVRTSQKDTAVFGAADARGGYHFKYVGAEAGLMLWSGWDTPYSKEVAVLPELELSVGRRDQVYAVAGFGVPTVTYSTRPGGYAGLGIQTPSHLRLELRAGALRAGPGLFSDQAAVGDLVWYVPVRDKLDFRGSYSIGGNDAPTPASTLHHMASIGLAWKL